MQTRCKIAAALMALLSGTIAAPADEKEVWRLFVSDHARPAITAIDAMSGSTLGTFAVNGPATLFRSASGRTVLAAQGKADTVTAISSGVSFDDHGDHGDIEVSAPRLTGTEIAGGKPSHLVEHDGEFAVFFDKEGVARIVSEKAAQQGRQDFKEAKAGAPHHGVAATHGQYVLISEPHREKPDELPIGIKVVDEAGAQVGGVHGCPDLHGEASSGNILVFACATGLLVVTDAAGEPAIAHLPYPGSLPDGKSTTLLGGQGLQYFLGNYGQDKVVLIDPTAQDNAFRLIDLPTRRVHFAVDPVRPKFAYVFTEDGRLHQLDVIAGKISGSVQLTDPYSMDGDWSDPRPRIAVAGDRIVVTDPLKGKLHLVDAASFTRAGEFSVGGMPYSIVAVGGAGQVHESE